MRRLTQFSSLLLFSILLATMPLAAFAQEGSQTANPQKLLIFTSFPTQVIGSDESVTLPVKIHTDVAPQIVQLQLRDVPTGWTATLRGANRLIESAFVQPNGDAAVDRKLDPPKDAKAGAYKFTVVAQGDGVSAELPIALTWPPAAIRSRFTPMAAKRRPALISPLRWPASPVWL